MSAPLVLVPGLNNTRAVFDRLCRHLPEGTLALDNPPLDTVEAIAQVHLAQLPERFWLGGFSFGGYVALAMLELAPERVQGLALICTAPNADTPATAERRKASLAAVAEGRYEAMVMAQAPNAFHPDSLQNPELMAERMAMVRDYGPERYAAHVRATMVRPDRHALLDGRHPVMVVGASHDSLFTPAALAYAQAIPGVRRVTLEGAGHLLPMEQPAALARALMDWMAGSA